MEHGYNNERAVQILISLLKSHGIKKIVASPGATNVTFIGSVQYDPWFEIYSSVDERSAAYMACGMAYESGEPVCLSCTGATASRNYYSGMTEAYYKKLPVIAITSTQINVRQGNLYAQVIDRSVVANDVTNYNVTLPFVDTTEDELECNIRINEALLAAKRHGGGPVHINLQTKYSRNFNVKDLPKERVINRIEIDNKWPDINVDRIGIFIGSHKRVNDHLKDLIERFCEQFNAVVFCDHTSGYYGKYKVNYDIASSQLTNTGDVFPLLIHIGEVSGSYFIGNNALETWRVCADGEIRDRFSNLTKVFEMSESVFFEHYVSDKSLAAGNGNCSFYKECKGKVEDLRARIPELPFSASWIAKNSNDKIPAGSVIHFGIYNSLRTWSYFDLPDGVESACNVGGFGIDGAMSTLLGAALSNPDKLHFLVLGDLAFFYDMNALGNRHIGKNIRILLINNGKGSEFRIYNHIAAEFGDDADEYMAAAGHYGNKSFDLVKHYVTDLGFEYMTAKSKEDYLSFLPLFVSDEKRDKPVVFEIFTNSTDESRALELIHSIDKNKQMVAKDVLRTVAGEKGYDLLKKVKNSLKK